MRTDNLPSLYAVPRPLACAAPKKLPPRVSEVLERYATGRVSVASLLADDRRKRWVVARWFCWLELHEMGFSYPRIGRWFDKDHTTVMGGVKRLRDLLEALEPMELDVAA